MASRPLITPHQVITNGNMSASITSEVTVITNVTMVSYSVSWTGTSPSGVVTIEVSNDYSKNAAGQVQNAGTWTELPLSAACVVSGNSGNGMIELTDIPAFAIRLKYTRASGSGTMQAIIVAKVQ